MNPLLATLCLLVTSEASSPTDEYLYLFSRFDTDGFAPRRSAGEGDFDGAGSTFPDEILPAGKKLEVLSPRHGKVVFLRPRTVSGAKNMMALRGQTIAVRTKNTFNVLLTLGAAHDVPTAAAARTVNHGWVEFTFADGTRGRGPIGLSAWNREAAFAEEVAFASTFTAARGPRVTGTRPTVSRTRVAGGATASGVRRLSNGTPIRLWVQRTPIPADRVVTSIRLPDLPHLKILGLTLAHRAEVSPRRAPRVSPPEPAAVAIFDAPGFPYSQSAESATPERVQDALEKVGITARRIGVEHLRDPGVFNVERFPVTVMPHGDSFPLSAVDAIRAYRKSAGAMVLSGAPFTRPVEDTPYGGWLQRSPSTEFASSSGDRSLGVYPRSSVSRTRVWPSETLAAWGFGDLPWDRLEMRDIDGLAPAYRGLDTRLEIEGVELETLLNVGSWSWAVAGIVRHTAGDFAGCLDVHTVTSPVWIDDTRVATRFHVELLARAAAWCLKERGKLPDDAWRAISRPLDAASLDQEAPRVEAVAPEPFGLAKAKKIDGTVYWVDVSTSPPEDRVLLASAQGLVHRRARPAVFLAASSGAGSWLEQLAGAKLIGTVKKSTPAGILGMLSHRRAVVVDPDLHGSLSLATMIAALEGLLVAYPGHVGLHDLEVITDLRGTFDSHAEALEWAISNIRPLMRSDVLACVAATPSTWGLRDLLVREKVFTFDLPSIDRASTNLDVGRSREVARRVLLDTPLLTPVLGSSSGAPPIGHPGRAALLTTRSGKRFVNVEGLANSSFYRKLESRPSRPTAMTPRSLTLDTRKVYVAVLGEPLSLVKAIAEERRLAAAATRNRPRSASSANVLQLLPVPPRRAPAEPTPTAATTPYLPASIAVEVGVHDLIALPVVEHALKGSPASGLMLPGSLTPDGFGKAFGAGRPETVEALFDAVGKEMSSRGARFLQIAAHSAFEPRTRDTALGRLPTDVGVFIGFDPRRAGQVDVLSASRLVGEVAVFHDLGDQNMTTLLTNDGLEPYRKLFPLFLTSSAARITALQKTAAISDDVVLVRPEEAVVLAKEYHHHRKLTRLDVLARGARWRYHDKGEDLGSRWHAGGYDDSAWSEGESELGYGDAGEGRPEATVISYGDDTRKKHSCYYFRHVLELERKPDVDLLLLGIVADDGAIVYLNGEEVVRINMPQGEVNHGSFAPRALGSSVEADWQRRPLAANALRAGKNTLAVEVHQSSSSSSDMSFDLEITGWKVTP